MGMVRIEPIHRGEYFEQVNALSRQYDFASRYLLEQIIYGHWKSEPAVDDVVGYVLLDDEQVCGFACCMKSLRCFGGQTLVVNAASSALVKQEYRSYSLKLFGKLFSDGDLVLDLTPTDETYRFLMTPFFRCKQLDTAALAFSRMRLCSSKRLKATARQEEILALQTPEQRKLLEDNAGYRGRLCTVFVGSTPVTLVCRVFKKAGAVRIADILYIDNRQLFAENAKAIMAALCRRLHTLFCWCDSRFLPDVALPEKLTEKNELFRKPFRLLFGQATAIRRNSLYRAVTDKAKGITPEQLDGLYSEKIMM